MNFKDIILNEKNIAHIYVFSFLSYVAYYFTGGNVDGIREFILLTIFAVILLIGEILLIIVPVISALVGLKRRTIRKLPAVLLLLSVLLIPLYLIFMSTIGGGLGRIGIVDMANMLFHFAVPLSVLYGFVAFTLQSRTKNVKAAKVLGTLHALAGAGMTFFYYKIYTTKQAYDFGVVIPDVWYYSPTCLVAGYFIWALLGLLAGKFMIADKTDTEGVMS